MSKAKTALAIKVQGAPNDRQVDIYDVDATCENQPFNEPHRVSFRVKNWAPGLAYNLDFDSMVTLTYKAGKSALSMNGRVEVDSSGKTVGVRAINSEDIQVEGTIAVKECL